MDMERLFFYKQAILKGKLRADIEELGKPGTEVRHKNGEFMTRREILTSNLGHRSRTIHPTLL